MAAVKSANNSPQVGSKASPQDTVKSKIKSEEPAQTDDSKTEGDTERKPSTTNAEPLGPPAKPNTSGADADYFSNAHGGGSTFNLEPNPFEQSFGNPSSETPGKTLLPSVASLTSPSSLLPGGTPGWTNSLRSGPLSPAMLAGPTGSSDYFGDSHFRGGFPTPNESSLRTGLTPGGGGSMFPAASPGSQAFLNSLQSGGATPGTLDFHRTAMNAAAAKSQSNKTSGPTASADTAAQPATSQPAESTAAAASATTATANQDSYHDANDAANGLFMLAQANGARNNSQFSARGQPAPSVNTATANQSGAASQETSPVTKQGKGSVGSLEGADMSEDESKPATRSSNRNKKAVNTKAANNRRKADEPPSAKTPATKKAKGMPAMDDDMMSDEEVSPPPEYGPNGKKMTDEEKRKNFLERNRVAALKCRQRKKQWLASLQAKVEFYTAENEALSGNVNSLREEVMNLKTLLLAHKDCPITQQQGLNGMALANLLGDPSQHGHPYGMGMHNGMPPQGFSMQQAPPAGMHRR